MDTVAPHTLWQDPGTDAVRRATRALRCAEAEQLRAALQVIDDADRHLAAQDLSVELREVERRAVRARIAEAMRLSELAVVTLLGQARTAREELPCTWRGFCEGRLDARTLRRIVETAEQLVHPASVEALDERAAAWVEERRPAQIDAWLRRFVAVREPEEHRRRAQAATRGRGLWLEHLDEGMSYLHALLPTLTAEAIRNRLRAVAVSPVQPVPHHPTVTFEQPEGPGRRGQPAETRAGGDPRTLAEREADMFAAWLLTGRTVDDVPVDATVAVMVPLETLTGQSDAPAVMRDRSRPLPPDQLLGLLADPATRPRWHTMIVDPMGSDDAPPDPPADHPPSGDRHRNDAPGAEHGPEPPEPPPHLGSSLSHPALGPTGVEFEVLAHEYSGRFVPRVLRDAVSFRDGTCQAPGCTVSAERCDADHRLAWPAGPTSAENLQMLCRRHHRMKSHGVLPREEDTGEQGSEEQGPEEKSLHEGGTAVGPPARTVDLRFPRRQMEYVVAV
ncbi:HNH endonuclease signature motif containing protein [Nesterenkonia suensis]